MSWEATKWAWKAPVETMIERLVLTCLADMADIDNGLCYPAQTTVARITCLSERSVRQAMASLQKKNLIQRKKHFTRAGRTSDRIFLGPATARQRSNGGTVSGVIPQQLPRKIPEKLETALAASDSGENRHEVPMDTGTSCRESNQTEPIRFNQEQDGGHDLFMLMPEPGELEGASRNHLIEILDLLSPCLEGVVDWSMSGIKKFDLLQGWLDRCCDDFVLAQIIEIADRWRRSDNGSQRIKSWAYFKTAIERQIEADPTARTDPEGAWKRRARTLVEAHRETDGAVPRRPSVPWSFDR